MLGQTHSLTSLLTDVATLTGQSFVVLQCENAGGSQRLRHAFPAFDEKQLDILSDGALIATFRDDEDGRAGFVALVAQAARGYEETGSIVTSTITFVGRANEGEASRTAVLVLVRTIDFDSGLNYSPMFDAQGRLAA